MAQETKMKVLVIRDCRDATKDYYLDKSRAVQLYKEGKLYWDATNGEYCTPTYLRVE